MRRLMEAANMDFAPNEHSYFAIEHEDVCFTVDIPPGAMTKIGDICTTLLIIGTFKGDKVTSIVSVSADMSDLTWMNRSAQHENWDWYEVFESQEVFDPYYFDLKKAEVSKEQVNNFLSRIKPPMKFRYSNEGFGSVDITLNGGHNSNSSLSVDAYFSYTPYRSGSEFEPPTNEDFEIIEYVSHDGYSLNSLLIDYYFTMSERALADYFYNGP